MTKDFEKYQSQTNITWTIVSVCVAPTAEKRGGRSKSCRRSECRLTSRRGCRPRRASPDRAEIGGPWPECSRHQAPPRQHACGWPLQSWHFPLFQESSFLCACLRVPSRLSLRSRSQLDQAWCEFVRFAFGRVRRGRRIQVQLLNIIRDNHCWGLGIRVPNCFAKNLFGRCAAV